MTAVGAMRAMRDLGFTHLADVTVGVTKEFQIEHVIQQWELMEENATSLDSSDDFSISGDRILRYGHVEFLATKDLA